QPDARQGPEGGLRPRRHRGGAGGIGAAGAGARRTDPAVLASDRARPRSTGNEVTPYARGADTPILMLAPSYSPSPQRSGSIRQRRRSGSTACWFAATMSFRSP